MNRTLYIYSALYFSAIAHGFEIPVDLTPEESVYLNWLIAPSRTEKLWQLAPQLMQLMQYQNDIQLFPVTTSSEPQATPAMFPSIVGSTKVL